MCHRLLKRSEVLEEAVVWQRFWRRKEAGKERKRDDTKKSVIKEGNVSGSPSKSNTEESGEKIRIWDKETVPLGAQRQGEGRKERSSGRATGLGGYGVGTWVWSESSNNWYPVMGAALNAGESRTREKPVSQASGSHSGWDCTGLVVSIAAGHNSS